MSRAKQSMDGNTDVYKRQGAKAAKAAGIPYIIVPDINYPEKEVAKAAEMVADSLLDVEKLFAL